MDSKYDQLQINYNAIDGKKELVHCLNTNDSDCGGKDDILFELGMFSVCDSLISDDSNNVCNKDCAVSVDDLNNVSQTDLLFSNTDSYENILSENDLLNSVSDSVNFYNETVTLYGNDNDKELLFDCSVNMPSLDLESSENFHEVTGDSELSTNNTDIENISMADNLENIVPNLNVFTNINLDCVSENNSNHLLHQNTKSELQTENVNLSICKDLNLESCINEIIKTPTVDFSPEENFDPNEFLNFKGSKINNNLDLSLVNISKKDPTISVKNSKILSPPALSLLKNQSNLVVPAKRLKNVNGLATAMLYIKKSDINGFKNLAFINKDRSKISFNNNYRVKLKGSVGNFTTLLNKKPTVPFYDKVSQTTTKNNTEKVYDNVQVVEDDNSFVRECAEKIIKPKFYNNGFILKFSPDTRRLLMCRYTEDEFGKDDDKVYYYTGFPKYTYFMALLNCITLPNNHVISPFQMLLLTLMKLRLNLDWADLSYRFNKSVQIVKETFGLTVFILLECLSHIIEWPMLQYKTSKYCSRIGMNLYVYGIKLNINSCPKIHKKIFMCVSTLNHPIHFVSRPVLESRCITRMDILEISGIKDGLALRDNIIFDEEIDITSANGDRTYLSVISKNQESFCSKPYDNSLNNIEKLKNTVNEVKKFKYIYDEIKCSWVDESKGEFLLYNDALKVVCCVVNLCHVLPFCNSAVKGIIEKRRNLEILIT